MRIAILTHPPRLNYGGILQAYALQKVLSDMGNEVDVLVTDRRNKYPSLLMPLIYTKRLFRKLFYDKTTNIFHERKLKKDTKIISQFTQKFIDSYIKTRHIKYLTSLKEDDYNAYVVGSDQIWRAAYSRQLWHTQMPNLFLSFTKGWKVNRIAYAASFGLDNISEYSVNEINECKEAISCFDKVTVREESGIRICKENFHIDVSQVVDPTMLFSKEFYIHLVASTITDKSSGNLMCYILDVNSEKKEIIDEISSRFNMIAFNSNKDIYNPELSPLERIQPSVEQWLRSFIDAECVITDSFHACVFSIIFNKPFYVIGNKERGISRIESLLNLFELSDRFIDSVDSLPSSDIDWNLINRKLNKLRQDGLAILDNFIKTKDLNNCVFK